MHREFGICSNQTGTLRNVISAYLHCPVHKIIEGHALFANEPEYDSEEMWVVPEAVDVLLSLDSVRSHTESFGSVLLCKYKGNSVVILKDDSPIVVLFSGNDYVQANVGT